MGTIKYTANVKTSAGLSYTINLHDMDFSGSPTTLKTAPPGFEVTWLQQGDQLSQPIKSSSCKVSFNVPDSTAEAYFYSLLSKVQKKIYIVILDGNGDMYWAGPVLCDLIQKPYSGYEEMYIDIEATDGLKMLENINFCSTNWSTLISTPYAANTGFVPVTNILSEILMRIFPDDPGFPNSCNPFYQNTSGLFSVATVLRCQEMVTTGLAGSDLERTYLNPDCWKVIDKDIVQYKSYYEVLTEILTGFGMHIILSGGFYRIQQMGMFDYYATFEEKFYKITVTAHVPTTAYLTVVTSNNSQAVSNHPGNNLFWSRDPQIDYLPGLKKVISKTRFDNNMDFDSENPLSMSVASAAALAGEFIDSSMTNAIFHAIVPIFSPSVGFKTTDKLRINFALNGDHDSISKIQYIYVKIRDTVANKTLSGVYSSATGKFLNIPTWVNDSVTAYIKIPYIPGQTNIINFITPTLYANDHTYDVHVYMTGEHRLQFQSSTRFGYGLILYDIVYRIPSNIYNKLTVGDLIYIPSLAANYAITIKSGNATLGNYVVLTSSSIPAGQYKTQVITAYIDSMSIDSGDDNKVSLDNFNINYLRNGEQYDDKGYYFEADNPNATLFAQYNDQVELGECAFTDIVIGSIANAIQVYSAAGPTLVLSRTWKDRLAASDTAAELMSKVTEFWMKHQRRFITKMNGMFFTETAHQTLYLPHRAIICADGYLYVFNGGTYSAMMDEMSGEWVQFEQALITVTSTGNGLNTGEKFKKLDNSIGDITKDIHDAIGNNAGVIGGVLRDSIKDLSDSHVELFSQISGGGAMYIDVNSTTTPDEVKTGVGLANAFVSQSGILYQRADDDSAWTSIFNFKTAGDGRYLKLSGGTMTGAINLGYETASRALILDSSKNITVSSVTDTELGYLGGATSNIQNQINNIVNGMAWKAAARLATTANITLSGTQDIDGVPAVAGDRILVKNQSTGANNGIYICAAGAWSRSTDADSASELLQATISVEEGTANADTIYTCTANAPIVVGSTTLTFAKTSGSVYTASGGLQLSGNDFSIASGGVTNAMLAGSIAYSKLSLTGAILNADLAGSISDGKLATSYIKADGSRGLTANWNAGAWTGIFNGVQIGNGVNTIKMGSGSGGVGIISSTDHATKGFIYFGSSTAMSFDEVNGRLGIGVSNPATLLDIISSGTSSNAMLTIRALGTGTNNGYCSINFGNNVGANRWAIGVGGGNETFYGVAGKLYFRNPVDDKAWVTITPVTGETTFFAPIVLKNYTVATLPTPTRGMVAYCTDLTTPTYRANAVGGGAVVGMVFYDGTNWIT